MPKTAILPDGRTATFPDDATTEEITAAVNASSPAPSEDKTFAQSLVRGAAPSIVGGALGGAAGTMVAPGPGTLIGTSLGSMAGEALQQFVDPLDAGTASETAAGKAFNIGIAGAAPFIAASARRFFLSLPGAAAGLQEFLFEKFGKAGERLISQFAPPPGTSKALFQQASKSGAAVRVALTETGRVTDDLTKEIAGSKFATSGSASIVKRAQDFVKGGATSFDEFRLNQSDLGAAIRALERKGGAALGRAKLLYAAMWRDAEKALTAETVETTTRPMLALPPAGGSTVTGPGRTFAARPLTGAESASRTLEAAQAAAAGTPYREAAGSIIDVVPTPGQIAPQRLGAATPSVVGPTMQETTTRVIPPGPTQGLLKNAIAAFKQEEAAKFVKDAWVKSTVRRAGQSNIDIDAFMTKIDRNRDVLTNLIPESDVDEIIATMREVAKIPVMAKTPRLGFEQMPFAERAVVSGALGLIGGATTGSLAGTVVGGATGVLAVEGISIALASKAGRALVRQMAANGAGLDQIATALIQPLRTAPAAAERNRRGLPPGG